MLPVPFLHIKIILYIILSLNQKEERHFMAPGVYIFSWKHVFVLQFFFIINTLIYCYYSSFVALTSILLFPLPTNIISNKKIYHIFCQVLQVLSEHPLFWWENAWLSHDNGIPCINPPGYLMFSLEVLSILKENMIDVICHQKYVLSCCTNFFKWMYI